MEASWPPKKPKSYFRTLRRLLDLLVYWGMGEGRRGEERREEKWQKSYIRCLRGMKSGPFALETVSRIVIILYTYMTIIYMIKTRPSVFLLVFASFNVKIERVFPSSGVATP